VGEGRRTGRRRRRSAESEGSGWGWGCMWVGVCRGEALDEGGAGGGAGEGDRVSSLPCPLAASPQLLPGVTMRSVSDGSGVPCTMVVVRPLSPCAVLPGAWGGEGSKGRGSLLQGDAPLPCPTPCCARRRGSPRESGGQGRRCGADGDAVRCGWDAAHTHSPHLGRGRGVTGVESFLLSRRLCGCRPDPAVRSRESCVCGAVLC
jgi:hypothetical protein